MNFLKAALIFICLLMTTPTAYSADKEPFVFKKQSELQQIRWKKPVKIKLKITARDEYSWELSGGDVDEIVQADKRLRKLLDTK